MKSLRIVFGLLILAVTAQAQKISPAIDPDSYQPQIGVPGEIDTIYGSHTDQRLGDGPGGICAMPDGGYNRFLFKGYPNNPNGFDMLMGGPGLDIHDLDRPKARFYPKDFPLYKGHFQNSRLTDVLDGNTIYWADEDNLYDSTRYTVLGYRPLGPLNGGYVNDQPPYIAHLSSDTVDDIVVCMHTGWNNVRTDSLYIVHYTGGSSLMTAGDTILNDSSIRFGVANTGYWGIAGDFRGSGREDFLAEDIFNNLFFYKNDPPFSLSRFLSAMQIDTLYAPWQNPEIPIPTNDSYWKSLIATRVFPKAKSDRSIDFEAVFTRFDDVDNCPGVNFFRGGPSFGSHRLFAKDTDFAIRCPNFYDHSWAIGSYGGGSIDCGDLTGTGYPVVELRAVDPSTNYSFYYVMGPAMDAQADMYYAQYYGGITRPDTVTADGDHYQDLLGGNGFYRTMGGTMTGVGTIELIHGSPKIPVKISSRWSGVVPRTLPSDSLAILGMATPELLQLKLFVRDPQSVEISVFDILGRRVARFHSFISGNEQVIKLTLPEIPSGTYIVEAIGREIIGKRTFSVLH